MSLTVDVCFPSCNPERAATATKRWLAQGYEVRIFVEEGFTPALVGAKLLVSRDYPGYWVATNILAKAAVAAGADVVVCIGDDMDPDPNLRAEEIAAQYLEHFPDGFGVMQPTGDTLSGTSQICGSPWLGRGWVERAYDGQGPLWPGYRQFFGDEELLYYARQLGVLWQRPDLTQFHHHWMRKENGLKTKTAYQTANDRHWKHDEDLFRARRAAGFPSQQPQESAVAL